MRTTIAAVAVLALTSFAANAADTSVRVTGLAPMLSGDTAQRRVVVQFADLNLADKQAAATLLDRITKSADAVCTTNQTRNSAFLTAKIQRCRDMAVAQAVKDVDSPELSAAASVKNASGE